MQEVTPLPCDEMPRLGTLTNRAACPICTRTCSPAQVACGIRASRLKVPTRRRLARRPILGFRGPGKKCPMRPIHTLPALPLLVGLAVCPQGPTSAAARPTRAEGVERIALDRPELRFPPGALGGIRTILRYKLARPNRIVTAILFLALPDRRETLPVAVQVQGSENDGQLLRDVEGADCTLARVGLYRTGKSIVALEAVRHGTPESPSYADPDVMEVRIYQLGPGSNPGDSDPMFTLQGTPTLTRPLCALKDVDAALDAAARAWRPAAPTPRP